MFEDGKRFAAGRGFSGVATGWRCSTPHSKDIFAKRQGLVRPERTGPLELDSEFDPEVLRHVDVLKLAEDEARVLVGEPDEESLRSLGVPEIVVTLGSRGSLVLANGKLERVTAQPVTGKVDPTGAGDAFSAAYLVSRAGGHAPAAAARRATGLVTGLLGGRLS